MRPSFLFTSLFVATLLALFLFTCTTAPTKGPTDRSNTTITLVGKSSKNISSSDMVDDSVGNTISIGFYNNFPQYLDSVELRLILSDTKDSVLQTFTNLTTLKPSDTSWHSMSFSDSGTKTIYGKAYINSFDKPASDYLQVIIRGKPLNHKPHVNVTGPTTILAGQQCILTITAIDTDMSQTVVISALKTPSSAVYNAGIFNWTPPTNFAGTDTAIFIAKDNGYPIMFDTARVAITVTSSSSNHAPAWQKNTINEVGQPGVPIAITLSDKCTDPDGDTLTFSLLSGLPDGDSIANSATSPAYAFTPGQADTGVFYARIVAQDPKAASDTLTIALSIHAPKIDSLPPTMKLVYPASDNASVSSSALAVKIQCTDLSGVANVRCSMAADTFLVTHSDSIYTAAISGLKQGVFDTIAFIAVDASSRANADTFFVHIKYDSSMVDNVPPAITLISPSKDTIIGSDSCVVRVKCTDQSGIASVVYALGSQKFNATKSPTADSIYIATVKGLTGGVYSTITVIAIDASPAANKDSANIRIKYDNDKTPPTLRLFSPSKDSASVAGNATTIQVVCKDASGVASLTCSMGSAPLPMIKSANADSIWSANVTGLTPGYTTLRIIAIDSALAANRDTLLLHILYDTTKADAAGPTITKVSSSITGNRTANPNDTLVYTVTDPSGVDTVSWTLNGVASGVLTAAANGQYSIKAVLTKSHTNKIVLIASDKSANHNKSSDTTILNYNRPPIISGAHDTTIQELSTVQFTVTATDPDSDNVTLSASTLPTGATFNATTGVFAWTPTSSQSGANAVVFKANDGLDTATKTISIVVSNMPPPAISKNPVADTVCLGGSASFFVVATGAGLTYQWKNAAGNLSGAHYKGVTKDTLTIDTVKASDAATYTCVVTNSAGSVASSTGAKLTVNMPSTAPTLAANNANVCSGGSVTFTMTGGTLGTGATWAVYAGTTKLSTQPAITSNSFTISNITAAASYSVKAEGGTCDNASSPPTSNSVAIAINQSSTAPTLAGGSSSVCSGGSVTFTMTGGTLGTGATWAVYAGTSKLSTQPAITSNSFTISNITAAASYSVKAENGSCDNASSPPTSNSVAISLNQSSTAPTLAGGSSSVCSGGSVTFTMTGGTLGTGATWAVYAGTTKLSTQPAITSNSFTISNITTPVSYSVKAEGGTCDNAGSPSTSNSVAIAVNQPSTAPTLAVASSSSASICPGGSVTFTMTGGTLGAGATWAVYAGTTKLSPQPTITNNSFTISNITSAASYSVKAAGGTCDNASSPPTSYSVAISILTYNVTFNCIGGSPVPPVQIIPCNDTVKTPTAPTKSCNIFAGWYKESDGLNSWNFHSYVVIRDTTIYAKWTPASTPIVSVVSTSPICAGNAANFSASVNGATGTAPFSYQWYQVSGGAVGTNSSSLSIPTPSQTGGATAGYNITCYCIVTDDCSKKDTSSNATVLVNYLPEAPIVEWDTDPDALIYLKCAVMQSIPSTYYCCYFRYNKNDSGWTQWSNTAGGYTCDGLLSDLGNAVPTTDKVQVQAFTRDTVRKCDGPINTQNWPQP